MHTYKRARERETERQRDTERERLRKRILLLEDCLKAMSCFHSSKYSKVYPQIKPDHKKKGYVYFIILTMA